MQPEVNLLKTRLVAMKLVLGESETEVVEVTPLKIRESVATASDKGTPEKAVDGVLPGAGSGARNVAAEAARPGVEEKDGIVAADTPAENHAMKAAADAATAAAAAADAEMKKEAGEKEKGPEAGEEGAKEEGEDKEEEEEEPREADKEGAAEMKESEGPEGAGGGGEDAALHAAVEKSVDDEEPRAADRGMGSKTLKGRALSTVAGFRAESGGAAQALRRYLASFGPDATPSLGGLSGKLGQQAPCRSYQFLKTLGEIEMVAEQLEKARTKQGLANLVAGCKPHKSAVRELVTMSLAAGKRLTAAMESVRTSKKKAADAAAAPATSMKRARRAPTVDALSLLQGAGKQPARVSCALKEGKLQLPDALVLDSQKPCIFYISKATEEEEYPHEKLCRSFREFFGASEKRADPGRARKLLGACLSGRQQRECVVCLRCFSGLIAQRKVLLLSHAVRQASGCLQECVV